tara:strand:- start:21 stop:239 length:219 start_codon:yes stop_codon:yes gene_type:complete
MTRTDIRDLVVKATVNTEELTNVVDTIFKEIGDVSQQRELLSWMKANHHLAKTEDQINELLLDYNFEQLNCG